jgi:nucleoside-diphosphate-sugar epimerase
MPLIIIGSEGNVGRRLMKAFPGSIGIDRVEGADIVANIATIDYDAPDVRAAFEKADGVIHLATSPNVQAPDSVHWEAVVGAARLMEACDRFNIKRVVLPSSDWAEPKTRWAENEQNAYGRSKRIMEEMALMYNMTPGRMCVALRIGWVHHDPATIADAADWLKANLWDDERLIGQMKAALGMKS